MIDSTYLEEAERLVRETYPNCHAMTAMSTEDEILSAEFHGLSDEDGLKALQIIRDSHTTILQRVAVIEEEDRNRPTVEERLTTMQAEIDELKMRPR